MAACAGWGGTFPPSGRWGRGKEGKGREVALPPPLSPPIPLAAGRSPPLPRSLSLLLLLLARFLPAPAARCARRGGAGRSGRGRGRRDARQGPRTEGGDAVTAVGRQAHDLSLNRSSSPSRTGEKSIVRTSRDADRSSRKAICVDRPQEEDEPSLIRRAFTHCE